MIVDAEVKETNKTTRGSERRSVLEKGKEEQKKLKKGLDRADIVIALGKLGRGGTEDETVKPLEGVQRVQVPHGQSEHAGR
ncbi:MAG: hypothetical protein DMG38_28655 [Acidobacteria bacterium]|nr:MAG: hypothetical protein DMG38_28655 [Acidobacteriota bacterium]